MTEAEVRALAPRIAEYVQSRVRFSLDTNAPARGVLSNWPPAQLKLTTEERPGEILPAPLPLTLRWEIPVKARQLELSLSLFDTTGFAALFEVLFHRGKDIPPVLQLVQARQAMVIDLDAFQEDTRDAKTAPSPPTKEGAAPAPVRGNSVAQFIELGFTHILPKGLDHILFVLGLFLLSPKLKPLLWQVTAFTLAHSITLALAVLGIFALPGRVVEPIIALSIAVVAIENLYRQDVSPWRWACVFGFGLIHGMGFAGVLSEVGLPREQIGTALISFNVGVELGQLAVIALAFGATKWCENRPWYGPWVRRPLCLLIALAGVVWMVQRLMEG
ncbi:MAG: HupE/UreJ family protein [Proteobacteria bacterium]|nr:HupE/UreJ family protein [Pseudomonadota bacterium]